MRANSRLALAIAFCSLLAFSGTALASDVVAGKAKADACLDCHEADYFAGSDAAEIAALIRAGRAGEFKHKDDAIRELAEEDIADVAAYFAHEGGQ